MADPDLAAQYRARCQARLETAGLLLQRYASCQFDLSSQADIARSNIGMLIWSAAIDLASCIMLSETTDTPNGNSPEVTRFITRTMRDRYPHLGLPLSWGWLAQLHNVQHRAEHQAERFREASIRAYPGFATLNWLLPAGKRITPQSYCWLNRVRVRQLPFRDEPIDRVRRRISRDPALATRATTDGLPIELAAGNMDGDVLNLLLQKGVGARTPNGVQAALRWAASIGTPTTVNMLIEHGADVQDRPLSTPLHRAAGANGYDTVWTLINHGALINALDHNRETPLHLN